MLVEHCRVTTESENLIIGDMDRRAVLADFLKVTVSSAQSFCKFAKIGDFQALSGFDASGSFLVRSTHSESEFLKSDLLHGWNAGMTTEAPCEFDPVDLYFRKTFHESPSPSPDTQIISMLPLQGLINSLASANLSPFCVIRSNSGRWKSPSQKTLSSEQKRLTLLYYGLARILYSQRTPACRLLMESSNGFLLGWKSLSKVYGFLLWNKPIRKLSYSPFCYVDGLAKVYAS